MGSTMRSITATQPLWALLKRWTRPAVYTHQAEFGGSKTLRFYGSALAA